MPYFLFVRGVCIMHDTCGCEPSRLNQRSKFNKEQTYRENETHRYFCTNVTAGNSLGSSRVMMTYTYNDTLNNTRVKLKDRSRPPRWTIREKRHLVRHSRGIDTKSPDATRILSNPPLLSFALSTGLHTIDDRTIVFTTFRSIFVRCLWDADRKRKLRSVCFFSILIDRQWRI